MTALQETTTGTPDAPAGVATTAAPARPRDHYVDVLRALALLRVIVYHAFGWAWLPLLFPSMGVMFALGGGLVAASIDRAPTARVYLTKRLTRLLPPFWVFGLAVVPVMLVLGWRADDPAISTPLTPGSGWAWVVPLASPPSSEQGYDWVLPLWYISTYLWFVLLSPALLWLFRRWPLRVLALPLVGAVLLTSGLANLSGSTAEVLGNLSVFGACWLLGFAHHDGTLRRLPLVPTVAGGLALMAAGAWYALSHAAQYGTWDIDDIPPADLLYCLGAVLVLLRLYPQLTWLERLPTLHAVVTLFTRRAMTIYLWGNLAIALAPVVLDATPLRRYDTDDATGEAVEFAAAWALIVVAVLLVGWVEDVAARRRPQLLPWQRGLSSGGQPRTRRPRVGRVLREPVLPQGPLHPATTVDGRSYVLTGNRVVELPVPAPLGAPAGSPVGQDRQV